MRRLVLLTLAAVLLTVVVGGALGQSAGAPTGLTGLAKNGAAELAWQPVAGADAYVVLRGTTQGSISQQISPPGGVTSTSFTDTTTANGTAYFYVVRAVDGGVSSANSNIASVTPRAVSCSGANSVITENCFPGAGSAWQVVNPAQVSSGGIEGYATRSSIDAGESVELKVNAAAGAPYSIQIYRTGAYNGSGARLVSVLPGLAAQAQPACVKESTTGLTDCAGWTPSAVLTTTGGWQSGVYLLRLVRGDNGRDFHILLTVRDDDRAADVLYPIPDTTYQAYNNYGGRSTYDWNSSGGATVAGTDRAVKVSFDRPYEQVRGGAWHDWYPGNDYRAVRWLEGEGYDITYATVSDLERDPGLASRYQAVISGGHDEYYSSGMRNALEGARNSGTSLFFTGANAVYWQVRFEDGPGGQDRRMVVYKSIQSGGPDPQGPTSTWRDPAGANEPENALVGAMFIGVNGSTFFPLRVSAAQGQDPIWRHTPLASLAPGTSQNVGTTLVGWEWDARKDNGAEPAGLTAVATTPVNGDLEQGNGAAYQPGSAQAHAVKYVASSGALVVATGTNQWARGLGRDAQENEDINGTIRQATVNILSDMGVRPESPSSAIVLDPIGGPPTVTLRTPTGGATGVSVDVSPTATFSRAMNAATITSSSVTISEPGGATVPAAVTYSAAGRRVTIDPVAPLALERVYTVRISTAVTADDGTPLAAPVTWSFTTEGPPPPPTVTSTAPADGATGVNPAAAITATFSRDMNAATITGQSFRLATAGGQSVEASVAYAPASRVATLTPSAPLASGTTYTATITTAVTAADGTALAAPVEIDFTTGQPVPPPTVTASSPADEAAGVTIDSAVTATFSRDMNAATITGQSFTLAGPGGPVAAGVTYNPTTRVATLTPNAPLATSTVYAATLSTAITAADGTALAGPVRIDFTTSASSCPCQLMAATATPAGASNDTRDGRPAPGPWTRELGVKITANQGAEIRALRFYKSPSETGTHVGRIWTSGGTQIGQVTFTGESASGWQTQQLASPLALTAGQTYVLSVNANERYPITSGGLASQLTAGPVSTVVGGNGVFSDAAGLFPTGSWNTSNYFVDLRVVETGEPAPPPPTVTGSTPANGASGVAVNVSPTAVFSRDMDPATINSSSVTLRPTGGSPVPATISYDAAARRVTIDPAADLAYQQAYTAQISTAARAANGPALANPVVWSFTTEQAPVLPPPTVTASSPADEAAGVTIDSAVTATFSRDMNAATITGQSFTLAGPGGPVAAGVTYNPTTRVATLTPNAPLATSTVYAATLSTAITAADGTALAGPVRIDFTTSASSCPCQLMAATATPAGASNDTRDGRPAPGPWTRELGVKITANQGAEIRALRFYKSPSETGTHVGRIWTSGGTQIGQVTFTGESASGWQTQQLASPLALTAGQTYVLSVNANERYPITSGGLASQLTAGPVSTVVGGNGVFSAAAGIFPTSSFNNSNYFVDLRVVETGEPAPPPPTVTGLTPANGASGVAVNVSPTAVFSRDMDPATINSSSVTLRPTGGSPVPATISYDAAARRVTIDPAADLAYQQAYTAQISTAARAANGPALANPVVWSFTTEQAPVLPPPTVTASSPADEAAGVTIDSAVTATFSRDMNAATITGQSFTLAGPGGPVAAGVTYNPTTRVATLTPNAPLATSTVYAATLSTAITAADGTALAGPVRIDFTTSASSCPCQLMAATATPAGASNDTRDGRPAPGPWTRELGVKITANQGAEIRALRFYKSPSETGTHVGRIWTSGGTQIAQHTFTGESASGWQTRQLASPVALTAGQTYVISVNANVRYPITVGGLASQLSAGPIGTVVGGNGVYSAAAGIFPTSSFNNSNYFVDAVVVQG